MIVLCFAYVSEMMSREFPCHFEEMKCMIIPICTEFKYPPISFVSAMHALMVIEEFEEKYEEFEDKIWRNTSIHSVIPSFTMNESINK